jgi:hypothetical protein
MSEQWETVDVPRGSFISWGSQPGQSVTGQVIDYSPAGGTDFNDQPCPQLSLELTEATVSINKDGQSTRIDSGEMVVLNCGLVNLKKAVKAAQLEPGMLTKITFSSTVKVPKGTVKEFTIQKAPGRPLQTASQGQAAPPAADPWGAGQQGSPPF